MVILVLVSFACKSFYYYLVFVLKIILCASSAMLMHVLDIPIPSVRPSVTRWYCIKIAEHIVMLSSPHDSPFILVLCVTRSSRNSDCHTLWGR